MPYTVNNSLSLDTKIYRYMDLAKFLSLIHQKSLFFAKASSFEDGLEGMPTELDGFMGSGVAEMLELTVNNLWPGLSNLSVEDLASKEREHDVAKAKFDERTIETIFGPQRIEDYANYSSLFESVAQWVDVSCWHMDVGASESMAMWKIYGAGSAAVCVESTLRDVLNSMRIPQDMDLFADRVSYLDFESDFIGVDDPLKVFFHKSNYYDYEKELRFILYSSNALDPRVDRKEPGTNVMIDPRALIKRVRVSPASSAWFFELIGLIMKDSGFTVDVVKSKIPLR